jgi:hypothetical protein
MRPVWTPTKMAEREGFEPSVGVNLRRFSKPLPSATQPPLRANLTTYVTVGYVILFDLRFLVFLPLVSKKCPSLIRDPRWRFFCAPEKDGHI